MENDLLKVPKARPLQDAPDLGPMSIVFVADEAFPLNNHMMRPYPGREKNSRKTGF